LRFALELAAGIVAVVAGWYAGHGHLEAVTLAGAGGVALAAGTTGWRTVTIGRRWRHDREVLWPLHGALHRHCGRHELEHPRAYITCPPDYAEPGAAPVVVRVHHGFGAEPQERAQVERIIGAKIGLPDPGYTWSTSGRRPQVTVRPNHHPPNVVRLADPAVRRIIDDAPESAPVIGVAAQGRVVSIDLDNESPHLLVSMSTGGGKSTILKGLAAQLARNGSVGSIIDVKRHSHRWARGLPGFDYGRDITEIHRILVALGAEVLRRNHLADAWEGEGDPRIDEPRHVLLLEEMNVTRDRLKTYWSQVRSGPEGDPKVSPALAALDEIVFTGRAVKMHVLCVAQSATTASLGGPAFRENFHARLLARYTTNAWRMLAPEVWPPPAPTRHMGRCQVVMAGEAHATQALYLSDDEARALALEGVRPVSHVGSPAVHTFGGDASQASGAVHLGEQPSDATGRPVLRLVGGEGPEGLVTLRQAVDAEIVGPTIGAVRSARARDPEWPQPAGRQGGAELYRRGDLERWARNRPRAQSGGAS
jgi:hypothetical protein